MPTMPERQRWRTANQDSPTVSIPKITQEMIDQAKAEAEAQAGQTSQLQRDRAAAQAMGRGIQRRGGSSTAARPVTPRPTRGPAGPAPRTQPLRPKPAATRQTLRPRPDLSALMEQNLDQTGEFDLSMTATSLIEPKFDFSYRQPAMPAMPAESQEPQEPAAPAPVEDLPRREDGLQTAELPQTADLIQAAAQAQPAMPAPRMRPSAPRAPLPRPTAWRNPAQQPERPAPPPRPEPEPELGPGPETVQPEKEAAPDPLPLPGTTQDARTAPTKRSRAEAALYQRIHDDHVWLNNPFMVRGLGLAPAIVAATTSKNALMLGVGAALLLTLTRVLAVALCHLFGHRQRPLLYVVAAAIAYIPAYTILYNIFGAELTLLGIYLPLLVTDPVILKRMEAPELEDVDEAFHRGLNNTVGFFLALMLLGVLRELLGAGSVFGMPVLRRAILPLASQTAGGFLLVGLLAAVWTAIGGAYVNYKREEVRHLYADDKQ